LAVAVTAACPPLKAATLPAVIAAASSTTILFRVGKEDRIRQKIESILEIVHSKKYNVKIPANAVVCRVW
jgi:hypothetical protein